MKTNTPETDAAKAWIGKSNTPQPPMHAPIVPAAFAEKLERERDEWRKCADRLFVYAMETLSTATSMALYEAVKEDIVEYNRLKNGTQTAKF